MKKLLIVLIFNLFLSSINYASQLSISPQSVTFIYNKSANILYPEISEIFITNIDLDSKFEWTIQPSERWIKLDNTTSGSGNYTYKIKISIDKEKIYNFSPGEYQGFISCSSTIGFNIITINLIISASKNLYSYGIMNFSGKKEPLKIDLPYFSNWNITPINNDNQTINNFLVTSDSILISSNVKSFYLTDTINNIKLPIKINNFDIENLLNCDFVTSTATPVNFIIPVPASETKEYIKITMEKMDNSNITFYLNQKDFSLFEEPYFDEKELPNLKNLIINLGQIIVKKSGYIKIKVYNSNGNLALLSYTFKPITGEWSIIDHFNNYEYRYNLTLFEGNDILTGWLNINNKIIKLSTKNSKITYNGNYILSLDFPYNEYYIKIPYYLINNSHFYGFLMQGNTPISLIEGYKKNSLNIIYNIEGTWHIDDSLKIYNNLSEIENLFKILNLKTIKDKIQLSNNYVNIVLSKVFSNQYIYQKGNQNNYFPELKNLSLSIINSNTIFITGEFKSQNFLLKFIK